MAMGLYVANIIHFPFLGTKMCRKKSNNNREHVCSTRKGVLAGKTTRHHTQPQTTRRAQS